MKKIFLISVALFFFSCGYVVGQFQITSYFNPLPGEIETFIYADTNGISPGNSGANQSWNFSGVVSLGDTANYMFVLPSGTPYGSSFPTATIAGNSTANPTAYWYGYYNSSVFQLLGNQNSSIRVEYTDPKIFRTYPMSYGQTVTDTYRSVTYSGTNVVQKVSGSLSITYDAYGTLTLPSGTAVNCGRLKIISYEVDTLIFGTTMIEYIKDTVWIWGKSNYRYELFEIDKHWISEDGVNYTGFKWVQYIPNINSVGIVPVSNEIPSEFRLEQNYPNPFNPITTIRYRIPENTFVTMIIYDGVGRKIETLCNCTHNAGVYEIRWDASSYSSGIYYCKMIANKFVDTKRVILIK